MTTTDPSAIEVATAMVSNYLAGELDSMTEPVETVIDDPRLLGEVMLQLTVIAGEVLRTSTAGSGADPQEILRDIVRNLGATRE